MLLPAPALWINPDPRREGCTPRQKVTGASAPKVAERYPSWEAWPRLEAGLTAGMRRGLRLGENLETDSVPPVQTGSPRCFGAFWRSLGQLGQGKVLVKEHGAVQGVLDWGGTGALCRAGGGMQVGMGRGREPLGWEKVLRAVGQQMAEEDWSWALPAQRSEWGHPTAPGTAHGSRAPTLGSVTVPDPGTI